MQCKISLNISPDFRISRFGIFRLACMEINLIVRSEGKWVATLRFFHAVKLIDASRLRKNPKQSGFFFLIY